MLAVHPTTDRSHPTRNLSTAANIVSFHRAISIITDDEKVPGLGQVYEVAPLGMLNLSASLLLSLRLKTSCVTSILYSL